MKQVKNYADSINRWHTRTHTMETKQNLYENSNAMRVGGEYKQRWNYDNISHAYKQSK